MNIARSFQLLIPNLRLGGRYQVVRRLGVGGFSETFLAKDTQLPRHPYCVIKQLKPRSRNQNSWRVAKRLFDAEAEVLYQLGNHERIPRLLAHFEDYQNFYLVQEFIAGASLRQKLHSGQPWPEARIVALMQDILQILVYVHDQNVIHRDIKPSNLICRASDGRLVLIDFGAVKQVSLRTEIGNSPSDHSVTISIGTHGYMPMEQANGMPRFNSDIYAVGMIGIEALTGMRPSQFQRDSQTGELLWRQALGQPSQSDAPIQVSQDLAEILDSMVRCHFKERYQTVQDVLQAIEAWISQRHEVNLEAELAALAVDATTTTPSLALPAWLDEANSVSSPDLPDPSSLPISESAIGLTAPLTSDASNPLTDPELVTPAIALEPNSELGSEFDLASNLVTSTSTSASVAESVSEPIAEPLPEPILAPSSELISAPNVEPLPVTKPELTLLTRITVLGTSVTEKFVALQDHTKTLMQQFSQNHSLQYWLRYPARSVSWPLLIGGGGLMVAAAAIVASLVQTRLQTPLQTPVSKSLLATLVCQEPSPPALPSTPPSLVYPNGTRYYGDLTNRLPSDGRGIMVFPSGNRYDGEFRAGQRNGCGTYTFANGRRYIGQFQDDAFQGQGLWLLENGDRYVGEFQANRCHGEGTFIFSNGDTKHGIWRNGQLEGTDLSCDR